MSVCFLSLPMPLQVEVIHVPTGKAPALPILVLGVVGRANKNPAQDTRLVLLTDVLDGTTLVAVSVH